MEISSNNPVSNQVQGLESTPKISEVKREQEEATRQGAAQTEENPDYRISLSEESKQAVAELATPSTADQPSQRTEISDEEAVRLAEQASEQLSQTQAAISNQAIQKAVDLFT